MIFSFWWSGEQIRHNIVTYTKSGITLIRVVLVHVRITKESTNTTAPPNFKLSFMGFIWKILIKVTPHLEWNHNIVYRIKLFRIHLPELMSRSHGLVFHNLLPSFLFVSTERLPTTWIIRMSVSNQLLERTDKTPV